MACYGRVNAPCRPQPGMGIGILPLSHGHGRSGYGIHTKNGAIGILFMAYAAG